MNNDYRSPAFKKWLDKLQTESWQLELIISGFAIYGLLMALDPIDLKAFKAQISGNKIESALMVIAKMASYILIFNLVVHVLLRGLWIGAIGLRYVSGDIDYTKLNYSPKFTNFLKKKVGSFDKYIAKLENYCSVLFAVSFLLVFYVLGFFLTFFLIVAVTYVFMETSIFPEHIGAILLGLFALTMFFLSFIVFLDFLGQGFLKKKKWTSFLYFPIYRLFGIITLSFLYRPLVYNFLDNKFGKRLSLLLTPIYLCIVLLSSMEYRMSNFLSTDTYSSAHFGNSANYDDESVEKTEFVKIASIPSKIINTNYLKLFVVYSEEIEDNLLEFEKKLKPQGNSRGYQSSIIRSFMAGVRSSESAQSGEGGESSGLWKNNDSINKLYSRSFSNAYIIDIDGKQLSANFIISTNLKDRLGFETYIDLEQLPKGKHILTVYAPNKLGDHKNSEKKTKKLITIPFWYFPTTVPASDGQKLSDLDQRTTK